MGAGQATGGRCHHSSAEIRWLLRLGLERLEEVGLNPPVYGELDDD